MNKKLLLVAGVLSIVSGNVMAKPIDMSANHYIDEGGKNIYVEKITSTQDGVELKTPGIRINLIDAIKVREVGFKTTKNGDGSDSYATISNGGSTYYNSTEKEENGAKISNLRRTVTEKGDFKIVEDYFVFKDGKRVKADYKESMVYRDGFMINHDKYDGDYGSPNIGKEMYFTLNKVDVGNNKINNVTAGTADTDAVNVSQLKETNKKVDDNTKVINNHENRIGDLENKITDVSRNALERANHYTDLQVNKGVAKASALAGLKFLDYNPKDKWSFAASVGHYRNANAVAVGAAYQPNENTMIHSGITVDGKVAYNLGVSVKVSGQKYINKYELAEQVRQLQSDNAELRQELAELRSMIEKR